MALHAYLATHTLEDLEREFSIRIRRHPTLPIAILNYDQIRSPKRDPVVRECRQKVVETTPPYRVVSRSFDRFFDLGGVEEETQQLRERWADATLQEKHDGSLITVFWYGGEPRVITRASFADLPMDGSDPRSPTWESVFRTFVDPAQLPPGKSCVFEMCTWRNRVVRAYAEDCAFLLTVVDVETGVEDPDDTQDALAARLGVGRPRVFRVPTYEALRDAIAEEAKQSPGFEGVVARVPSAKGFVRIKVKDPTYLEAHYRFVGPLTWAALVSIVLRGELDEVLAQPRFNGRRDDARRVAAAWASLRDEICGMWRSYRRCPDPKALAQAMQADGCTCKPLIFRLYREQRDRDEVSDEFFIQHAAWIADRLGALLGP